MTLTVGVHMVREARRAMELNIEHFIRTEMAKFRERTGLSPRYICLEFADVTTVGQEEPEYVLTRVRAEVSL